MRDVKALYKIIILYTLNRFQVSMSAEELQTVLLDTEIMDFFTYQCHITELLEDEYIATARIENKERYSINPKGLETANIFWTDIPQKITEKIDNSIREILAGYSKLNDVRAVTRPLAENRYAAKCGIYERGIPLLELNLTAGDRTTAERIAQNFRTDHEEIYRIIFDQLGKTND